MKTEYDYGFMDYLIGRYLDENRDSFDAVYKQAIEETTEQLSVHLSVVDDGANGFKIEWATDKWDSNRDQDGITRFCFFPTRTPNHPHDQHYDDLAYQADTLWAVYSIASADQLATINRDVLDGCIDAAKCYYYDFPLGLIVATGLINPYGDGSVDLVPAADGGADDGDIKFYAIQDLDGDLRFAGAASTPTDALNLMKSFIDIDPRCEGTTLNDFKVLEITKEQYKELHDARDHHAVLRQNIGIIA